MGMKIGLHREEENKSRVFQKEMQWKILDVN
jgi:hypothetical protein